jgi:endoglucanase
MRPTIAGVVLFAFAVVVSCTTSRNGAEPSNGDPEEIVREVPAPPADTLSCNATRNPRLCATVSEIRAVNLGNALEAPVEGQWGVTLNERDFRLIAEAGFNTVRVPIRWSAHADADAPFAIDQDFFERVDWVIEQSQRHGLLAIINMHHYEEIFARPQEHADRFLGLWEQIAARYQSESEDTLWFELLNEPHGLLNSLIWGDLMNRTLANVRASNPTRPIVVGGADWNSVHSMQLLRLPTEDDNLVLTFHYYKPFVFTHQGASWTNLESSTGVKWPATQALRQRIDADFASAKVYAKNKELPVLLGEFGAYSKADMVSRIKWTTYVRKSAEATGFGWAYWEFRAGFGIYDATTDSWREGLVAALLQ